MNQLRISLVIPAYNEERHLRSCLEAIANQTVSPDEVLLVDNNSTDGTRAIAEAYPFVKVLSEERQGVVFARDRGFIAAQGDIIGRIDADTVIDKNWIENVRQIFTDPSISAVSGVVRYYDMPLKKYVNTIDLLLRSYLAMSLNDVYLFGANMAVRKSSWNLVQQEICRGAGIHEDFDLAVHLSSHGEHVEFDDKLWASISNRRMDSTVRDFYHYVLTSPRTYSRHKILRRYYMYPVVVLALCFYVPLRALHRGFDHETQQFSIKKMFLPKGTNRVDPTLYHESVL